MNIYIYINLYKGNETVKGMISPDIIVDQLVNNYVGYAEMINMVSEWTIYAKYLQNNLPSNGNEKEIPAMDDYNRIKIAVEDELIAEMANFISLKFNKQIAETVFASNQYDRKLPGFLLSLLKDKHIRHMFIELYNHNNNSLFLGKVIMYICNMGFAHEINNIVKEPEFLSVIDKFIQDALIKV